MKHLGIVSYKKATGVKQIRHDHWILHCSTGPRKPEDAPVWRVSHALDAHLRAWLAGALQARNLQCGALQEGFDYIGGTKEWPELVHIGALAQSAGRSFVRRINRFEMGIWLGAMGATKCKKVVHRKNHKGRVTYTTHRVFYYTNTFRMG